MITNDPLHNYIIQNLPDSKYSASRGWIDCKCPVCDGESNKRHFNIQLKEGEPMIYKCFRASCGISGVLNRKMARQLGLVNPTFLGLIQDSFNKNIVLDTTKRNLIKGLTNIELGELSEEVKEYFKKRTGKELTKELQQRFRICSDIGQFLKVNNQTRLNEVNIGILLYNENVRHKRYIYFFNEKYTMVYARQINGDDKVRMSIVRSETLSKHVPYVFKSDGNTKYNGSKAENTLFLGEGIFDIINAYFYLYKDYQGVFMASTSFVSTVPYIELFAQFYYRPDIVILSDDDVNINVYRYSILRRLNKKRLSDIYVVYNLEGKDLGDYNGKKFKIETTLLHKGGG